MALRLGDVKYFCGSFAVYLTGEKETLRIWLLLVCMVLPLG